MKTISLDNIPGIAVDSFTPNLLEIALPGTDMSFTLSQVKYAETGYLFADLEPGSLAWILDTTHGCTILIYLGDEKELVPNSVEFVKRWKRHDPSAPIPVPIKVISKSNVDRSYIVKVLHTKVTWLLSLTDDDKVNIEVI